MSQLFGFQINRKEKGRGQSPVPPNADDGVNVAAGGYFGTYVETDAQARNDTILSRDIEICLYIQSVTLRLKIL